MISENINTEFAYEFFIQAKKASEKEEIIKPKIKEKELDTKSPEDLPFIRHLIKRNKVIKEKVVPKLESKIEVEPAISRIERLMDDSTVDSIECNGSDKKIVIKRGNRIIETMVVLSSDEINDIFDVTEKENNEKLGKIFQANFRNFTMHGIKSDFIGSSFILTRKDRQMEGI